MDAISSISETMHGVTQRLEFIQLTKLLTGCGCVTKMFSSVGTTLLYDTYVLRTSISNCKVPV